MKKILFIRHAKSSWKDPAWLDIDRPLKKRGFKDAQLMNEVIKKLALQIDLILSSPAKRTLQTAEIFRKNTFKNSNFKIEKKLYDSSLDRYFDIIRNLENKYSEVVIIGHNPVISYAASHLSNEEILLPTTGTALLDFDLEKWSEIRPGSGKLIFLGRPKEYR